jgi:hypothetical protein
LNLSHAMPGEGAMTDGAGGAAVGRRYWLAGYSDQRTEATIRIRSYDRAGRVKRAISGLLAWWGAAVVSVFIPVAHFFLVPGFLLFGLVTFVRRLKTPDLVVAAHGTCPDCGAAQDLDILGAWDASRDVICRECHRPLRLSADG